MAGRGTQVSFLDALQGLTGQIMSLAGTPDADVEFLLSLRDQVFERIGIQQAEQALQSAEAMGSQEPSMGAGGPPPAGGLGGGLAGLGSPGQMSRGPAPGMDTSGATAALEREMAGNTGPGA